MKYRLLFLCILLSSTSLYAAVSPSFNCAKASTNVENQICQSDVVATLDVKLAAHYKALVQSQPKIVKNSQKQWIKRRNKRCETVEADKRETCLTRTYGAQIAELNLITEQDSADVITAICENIGQPYYDEGMAYGLAQGGLVTIACLEGVLRSVGKTKIANKNWSKVIKKSGQEIGKLSRIINTQRKACAGHCGTLSNALHYKDVIDFYNAVIAKIYRF